MLHSASLEIQVRQHRIYSILLCAWTIKWNIVEGYGMMTNKITRQDNRLLSYCRSRVFVRKGKGIRR